MHKKIIFEGVLFLILLNLNINVFEVVFLFILCILIKIDIRVYADNNYSENSSIVLIPTEAN